MFAFKNGSTSPAGRLRTSAALLCLGFALLLAQPVQTQTAPPDALQFFKNYFVTGSHVVGGVGLQGRGVNGVATGSIPMSGAPEGADIVAAFLYWQVVTKDGTGEAGAAGVTFGPWAPSAPSAPGTGIPLSSTDGALGKILGTGTPPCWSSGGGTGSSGGATKTFTYRTDVLRFLRIDEATGKYKVNGAYQVQLPDGNGLTALGASLVVIYRDTDTRTPLKAIVLYDGAYTMDQRTEGMFQSIKGFYDGGASARLTHIVGSGQANKSEILRFNGATVATNPFGSSAGPGWDSPTFVVDGADLVGHPIEVTTSVDHEGFNTFDCLTWAAIIYETPVKDTDGDGLLDAWETATAARPVKDPHGQDLPYLGDMLADPNRKDVFIEIGYMKHDGEDREGFPGKWAKYGDTWRPAHSHLPTPAAIKLMGDAFKNAPVDNPVGGNGIKLHVDVGDPVAYHSIPGYSSLEADEYIIGTGVMDPRLARGGEFLDESITTAGCARVPGTSSVWSCQFSEYPGTVGWKSGFRYIRDEVIGTTDDSAVPPTPISPDEEDPCDAIGSTCVKRFDANRSDMFRYAFFAHAVGMPKSLNACRTWNATKSQWEESPDVNGHCPAGPEDDPGRYENPLFFTPRTNSGIADFPGRDILVTLGAFSDRYGLPGGTDFMVASTFFHELGHNIELRHGASQETPGGPVLPAPNCVPTYLSSMNYLYQLRGLLDDRGRPHLGFSSAIGSGPLDRIDEAAGTDKSLSFTTPYRIGWYAPLWIDRNDNGQLDPGEGSYFAYPDPAAPGGVGSRTTVAGRHCDGSLMSSTDPFMVRVDARTADGAIDWNANGVVDGYVSQDLNFNGRTTPAGATAELPQAFNDWANIRLNQIGAGRNVGGPFIDADGHRAFGPLSADLARADWARADWARADWARADWARADWARADWARADWGDLSQGDTVRYGLARADWARADWARADWARADWARADWGRGDDGRGDLGGGDLFVGNPDIAGGELDFETATDLARTPPNEFTACAIGVDTCAAPPATSGVLVTFKSPNIGGVTGYSIYRVPGNTLLPGQTWDPVTGVPAGPDAQGKYTLVDSSAGYGAEYTYFAVARYADGIQSDPSNLVILTTPKASSTVTLTCPDAGVTYNGSAQTPCTASYTTADGLTGSLNVAYSANTDAGTATASATYAGDASHESSTATASFAIAQAASTTTVTCPASVTYDGTAQTPCTASYTTADGLTGSLDVAYSSNTDAGPATASATWAGDGNHAGSTRSGGFTIAPAASLVTVSCPAGVTYTGSAQTPCTAQATGAGMSPIDVSASLLYSNNVNAGPATATASWPGDVNHTGSTGAGGFAIGAASSTTTVVCPEGVTYTGAPQTPCSASYTTADGLSGPLTVSYTSNTNAGTAGASAAWTGDSNHTGSAGSGSFAIAPAASLVTVSCPASVTYSGVPQTPCAAQATGAGMTAVNVSASLAYVNNVNAGPASATASWAGDANHTGNTGTGGFTINKATPVFSGLIGPVIKLGATPTALGGTLKAGSVIPTGSVSITLNGVTQASGIAATGTFSSSFATDALTVAGSPYTITYSYPGDANFTAAGPDTSQKVTVLWYGFLNVQNLPPPSSKTFNLGSAVPLRWQFTVNGAVYNSVNSQPQITIYTLTGTTPIYVGTPSDPGASSFQPPTASNGYTWQFNWQTKGRTAGTYRVYVGSVQTGQVYGAGAFGPFNVTLK